VDPKPAIVRLASHRLDTLCRPRPGWDWLVLHVASAGPRVCAHKYQDALQGVCVGGWCVLCVENEV
jgi:hypothetical protein